MKRQVNALLLLLLILSSSATETRAHEQTFQDVNASQTVVGTNIAYQGRLNDNSKPANGAYDLQFQLYDAVSGGTQVGNTVTQEDIFVTDGMFNVQLDFGGNAFDGNRRYLTVSVRPGNSNDAYTALVPRQELTPVPYALGLPNVSVRDGNLGIGTVSPATKLHVVGDQIRLENGSKQIQLFTTGRAVDLFAPSQSLFIQSSGKGPCPWECNNVIINPSNQNGNVGIGTVDPGINNGNAWNNVKLDVNGRVRLRQGDSGWNPMINFYDEKTKADRAAIGVGWDYTRMGFYSDGAGWGFVMDMQNGSVGIGTTNPQAKLDVVGTTSTKILQINGGADLAESFMITGEEPITPGFVVSIDPEHIGQLRVADSAYDRTVAGIVSGAGGINPGMVMQQQGTMADGDYPVSIVGRVYAWADASYNAIEPGDLLTTSPTPGHIMKVVDYDKAQGAIIGKAISGLQQGEGLILILVALQ